MTNMKLKTVSMFENMFVSISILFKQAIFYYDLQSIHKYQFFLNYLYIQIIKVIMNQQNSQTKQKLEQMQKKLDQIHKNHKDCVPVFFMKHPECTSSMKSPKDPFVLFKKDLQIQQAMYSLYKQIQVKGLYFFCPYLTKTKKKDSVPQLKYQFLKPGPSIQQIYKRFGRGGYLTLVYGDKDLGMNGMATMEKWMIRGLVLIGIIWALLFGFQYYHYYFGGNNQQGSNSGGDIIGGNSSSYESYEQL